MAEAPAATTDTLGRQVWDKEFYARRALARQFEDGLLEEEKPNKKKRRFNELSPVLDRRPLEERREALNLEGELGKMKIVTTHTPKNEQGGYWCDVCECLIKDSQAYLDHINGKRHNRLLGMTMRVERVGADRVRDRLEKEKERQRALEDTQDISVTERLTAAEQEERRRKKEKKENRRKRKEQKRKRHHDASDDNEPEASLDPAEQIKQIFPSSAF